MCDINKYQPSNHILGAENMVQRVKKQKDLNSALRTFIKARIDGVHL